jgi:hypothetical protein
VSPGNAVISTKVTLTVNMALLEEKSCGGQRVRFFRFLINILSRFRGFEVFTISLNVCSRIFTALFKVFMLILIYSWCSKGVKIMARQNPCLLFSFLTYHKIYTLCLMGSHFPYVDMYM